jgi:hypothetical protein
LASRPPPGRRARAAPENAENKTAGMQPAVSHPRFGRPIRPWP